MRYFGPFAAVLMVFSASAHAEKTFSFSFHETPLTKVIEFYSQQTGQKFVIDAALAANSKLTIVAPAKVTAKEAFNLLSASLALSGCAISNRDGTNVLASAPGTWKEVSHSRRQ